MRRASRDFDLAVLRDERTTLERSAMIDITTRSSMRVKPALADFMFYILAQ